MKKLKNKSFDLKKYHKNKDISPTQEDDKINKTVFYIYNSTLESNQINTITSSINILPTVINLFGLKTNYIYPGYDALNYKNGYVIFKDYTYYDGKEIKTITKEQQEDIEYSSNLLITDYYNEK